jgi:hypothetical protein
MTNQGNGTSNLYALLIGIDCYLPNRLPDGSSYPSLGGCVRDINHVEAFLKQKFQLPDERILKLTATDSGQPEPPEPRDHWPTYENMVAAFKRLTTLAQPGDQVYIHYSGHGGRTPTIVPEIKGPNAHDETLVPTDIGNSEARYLRDIELAKLLQALVDKQLVITVVLDSCHSGGATRGAGAAARGIDTIDTTARPTESLVASHEELAATWSSLNANATRDLKLGSGWLPEPKDYVLLAACRPSESAYEYAFNGTERNGALTYWLLDSLQELSPSLSYKVIHDRLIAKVHSQFEKQTPLLQGDGDRAVFGSGRIEPFYAVVVMQVDTTGSRVMLQAGQATGLRKGAQFAIYPRGTTDFADTSKRQAIVEVAELGATTSWAKILNTSGAAPIEQGAQALLLGAASVKLVRQVGLLRETGDIPDEINEQAALQALQAVEQAIASVGKGWLELTPSNDAPAEYHVAINKAGEYEIRDRTGSAAIANLNPPLRIDSPQAAAAVMQRLVHLTKYQAVQELDNHDVMSPLSSKLVVELAGVQQEYDPADKPEPQPFNAPGNTPTLKVGEWTFLRIKNTSAQSLNVTVLDLQPDWGISQVYPSGAGDTFVEIDKGEEQLIPLCAGLPDGYSEGRDILKVFATLDAADFRWLELPALDKPLSKRDSTRGTGSPLEALLAAVNGEQPQTRSLTPAANPSKEWVTAQIEVRVHKQKEKSV